MLSPLLQNAVAAIKLGVEDYKSVDAVRALSAARNLSAGVLLVFKEKLRQLSPTDSDEVLLKERIQPKRMDAGGIAFVGTGKKTVDAQQIKDRFKSLGVTVDWHRFDDLIRVRNELEHYHSSESLSRVRELIADAFGVLRTFLISELNLEPVELLGEAVWKVLLDVASVYETQLKLCRDELGRIRWPSSAHEKLCKSFRCFLCSSELMKPVDPNFADLIDLNFVCTLCGKSSTFDDLVDAAISNAFQSEFYEAMTDGGNDPIDHCPECGKFAFHLASGGCLVCCATLQFTHCNLCDEPLGPGDQDFDGYCGYHHHVLERDD
jgi:hypothetical protein